MKKTWFTADKKGLEQITRRNIETRGVGILIAELFQNSKDANATKIEFTIAWAPDQRVVVIACKDNGDGFHNLEHAYTMFAPSIKKGDATKAGRFNVGEKYVLSVAKEAAIETTCGTVTFNDKGRVTNARNKTEAGTIVALNMRLKKQGVQELIAAVDKLKFDHKLEVIVNGESLPPSEPTHVFTEILPTEVAGEDGIMKKTKRSTDVHLYAIDDNEVPMLYELGIPVVELAGGEKYHVDVQQKVPLNVDRDNVTPGYLRLIRVHVLNNTFEDIFEEDVTTTWVQEAVADERSKPEATKQVLHVQYGEDAVVANPFDPEANAKAVASGRTLIPTTALSRGYRDRLYERDQVKTSSAVFSKKTLVDCRQIKSTEWSIKMHATRHLAEFIAETACDTGIRVQMIAAPDASTVADFTRDSKTMRFNVEHAQLPTTAVGMVDLIIHELGHLYESNHLSTSYYNALTKIGAKLAIALTNSKTKNEFAERCSKFGY